MTRHLLALVLALTCAAGADGREYVRSGRVHRAFLKASGYPHGRPGHVADHIFPLCAGGKDVVENLQWQAVADAKVKDRAEWQLCRRLRVLVDAFKQEWQPVEQGKELK